MDVPAVTSALNWPSGSFGVAVSGGADSVALLRLALDAGHRPTVVHLDHETRAGASAEDADFVEALAQAHGLPLLRRRKSELGDFPATPAGHRDARMKLFAEVGTVATGHHALDQAETVLLRLIRGGSHLGLVGMAATTTLSGVELWRPMLRLWPDAFRDYLLRLGQSWREDSSNADPGQRRNRHRPRLTADRPLAEALVRLSEDARRLRDELATHAPTLPSVVEMDVIASLPPLVAEYALRRWLQAAGVPGRRLSPALLERVAEMATDRAAPRRMQLPGRRRLMRERGVLRVLAE
ncbi:MAG: tRNA lysidine(34) synthetase TilS [Planctomycetota bacterium]